jgi:hypothetical protein
MIKSKIDARERALELAIAYYSGDKGARRQEVLATAEAFATYLIGSAELPTMEPTVEDVTTKAIERLLSAYGLNGGEEVKPCANAASGFPIGGIVPQSEE